MANGTEALIKILHLEDNDSDSLLVKFQLEKDQINFSYFQAVNAEEFRNCLEKENIDIILSDYSLPAFSGNEALNLVKNQYPNIPFVFVSGRMGEETAIESLKNGATDYVLKNRLDLLTSAVNRALRESQLRREYQKASEALRQREQQYRTLVEDMNEGIMLVDNQDIIQFVNQKTCDITGYLYEELIGKETSQTLFDEKNGQIVREKTKLRKEGTKDTYDVQLQKKDKKNIWIRVNGSPVYDSMGKIAGSIGVFENIHDQKLAEEELRKLKRAVDQSPDSILITDTEGIIEYANPTTVNLTGYSKEELIGQKTNVFSSHEKSEGEYRVLWDTIKSGKVWTGEFHNKKKDGELYWESASVSPIFDNKGEITHFLAIKEDITDRYRLNQELILAKEQAEESDRLKSAFLANISHEIRTPMNGILGFSELLKMPDLTDEMRDRYIHIIEQSGKRMLNIINDIVDLSKIESGQENVHIQKTNLNQILKDLLVFFLPEARSKGLHLSYTAGLEDDICTIQTDQTKLIQIMTNLVKNALKFTLEGSIEFGYSLVKSSSYESDETIDNSRSPLARSFNPELESTETMLEFYVQDTGFGISEEQRSFIFDRFRQGSISPSRAYEGAGLGLSISKAYVEMLGGRMWVSSKSGQGSVFRFVLPMNAVEPTASQPTSEVVKPNESLRYNILLADDDENSRLFVKTLLEMEQSVVYEARNGKEAVDLVSQIPNLDLVLMDVKMPEMDGYEATRQIKKIRPELPILAQTAYAFKEEQEKAKEAGCDDYISKPLKRKVLEEKIKMLVRK